MSTSAPQAAGSRPDSAADAYEHSAELCELWARVLQAHGTAEAGLQAAACTRLATELRRLARMARGH